MKLFKSLTTSTLVLVGIFLTGCGDDPKPVATEDTTADKEAKVVDPDPVVDNQPVESTVDLEARAELMGFAKYVPGDFQTYFSVRPQRIYEKLKDTRLLEYMTGNFGVDLEQDSPVDFGKDCEEFVVTTGSTTAPQTEVLYRIASEINQLTYLGIYEGFAIEAGMMAPEDAKTGEFNMWIEAFPKELRDNFKAHVDLLEQAQMPMMIVAARFTDKTEQIEKLLAEMEQGLIDGPDNPLEVIELDRGPNEQLLAFKLNFSNVLDKESFLRSVEDYELTDAQFERLYDVLTSKTFVFGFGRKDDYLVMFAGDSVDQLEFAKSLEDSLVAVEQSAYLEKYADKELIYQQMASEEFASTYANLSAEPMKSYIEPMRDVLDRIDVLGDKRDLMGMLDGIESLGSKIYETNGQAMVGAGYIEDGYKLEIKGGISSAIIDYAAPSRFAALADDPSYAMVWSSNITKDGKKNVLEVEQLLVEFASAISDRYFDIAVEESEKLELYKFYKTELAGDLRKIWTAIKDEWAAGVGNEGVFLVDAKGSMPKFPVIPSEFAADAKIPRMAIMYPVTDRELLQKSWTEIEPSLRHVIEAISKRADANFTLPDSSVTESDDMRVYSYPVTGFTNDDFLPCMAVSDDYLVISSSKIFAMELVELMRSGEVVESSGGQLIDVNFSALKKYGRDMIEVSRKHETVLAEESAMQNWLTGIDDFEHAIDILELLDGVRYSTEFDENGDLTTFLHLRLKDYTDTVYNRIKAKDDSGSVDDSENEGPRLEIE